MCFGVIYRVFDTLKYVVFYGIIYYIKVKYISFRVVVAFYISDSVLAVVLYNSDHDAA